MSLKDKIKKTPLYPILNPINKIVKSVLKIPNTIKGPQTIVLLFHRVNNLPNDQEQLAVSPQNFETQLKFLKENYNILSLKDLYQNINNKKVTKKSVVITFDDGYYDNYQYAWPTLKKLQIPATIFIAGNGNQKTEFWWDELSILTDNEKEYKNLHSQLKNSNYQQRENILQQLYQEKNIVRVIRDDYKICSTENLKEMIASGITIGGHTLNHPQLSILNDEEQDQEIKNNFNYIKSIADQKIIAFAYPFGNAPDYNSKSVEMAKKYFDLAFANIKGQIKKTTDPYQIPRFVIKNWDEKTFAKKIKSFFRY